MIQVTLRVTEDSAKYVRRQARVRQTSESKIWRELIDAGFIQSDAIVSKIDRVARIAIQCLAVSQRELWFFSPEELDKAREDAKELISRMEARDAELDNDSDEKSDSDGDRRKYH